MEGGGRREEGGARRSRDSARCVRAELPTLRLGQLPGNPAVERSVVRLPFLLQRQGGALEGVEDISEVQPSQLADRIPAHPCAAGDPPFPSGRAGLSWVGSSLPPVPPIETTWITMAVMLSSPPR